MRQLTEKSDIHSSHAPRGHGGHPRVRPYLAIALSAGLLVSPAAGAADLEPRTIQAFDRYVRATEAQIDSNIRNGAPFLWVDRQPAARRAAAYAELSAGEVLIERIETLDAGSHISVPGGMIHHWVGTEFIPGATLAETLALEQDYDNHQTYFAPDVVRSGILHRDRNDFVVLLRFCKKKVITTVTETVHEVHYETVDATHAWSQSHSTRIQEVENAGRPDERLEPEGHDHGFLWAMNTYWRFEEKDGGTYVESQSISLSRDIPAGLGWLIGPYVTSVPRESLTFTLYTTRSAVLKRKAAVPSR